MGDILGWYKVYKKLLSQLGMRLGIVWERWGGPEKGQNDRSRDWLYNHEAVEEVKISRWWGEKILDLEGS